MALQWTVSHTGAMCGCCRLTESNGAAKPASKVHLLRLRLFDKRMHLKREG